MAAHQRTINQWLAAHMKDDCVADAVDYVHGLRNQPLHFKSTDVTIEGRQYTLELRKMPSGWLEQFTAYLDPPGPPVPTLVKNQMVWMGLGGFCRMVVELSVDLEYAVRVSITGPAS